MEAHRDELMALTVTLLAGPARYHKPWRSQHWSRHVPAAAASSMLPRRQTSVEAYVEIADKRGRCPSAVVGSW